MPNNKKKTWAKTTLRFYFYFKKHVDFVIPDRGGVAFLFVMCFKGPIC